MEVYACGTAGEGRVDAGYNPMWIRPSTCQSLEFGCWLCRRRSRCNTSRQVMVSTSGRCRVSIGSQLRLTAPSLMAGLLAIKRNFGSNLLQSYQVRSSFKAICFEASLPLPPGYPLGLIRHHKSHFSSQKQYLPCQTRITLRLGFPPLTRLVHPCQGQRLAGPASSKGMPSFGRVVTEHNRTKGTCGYGGGWLHVSGIAQGPTWIDAWGSHANKLCGEQASLYSPSMTVMDRRCRRDTMTEEILTSTEPYVWGKMSIDVFTGTKTGKWCLRRASSPILRSLNTFPINPSLIRMLT